MADMGQQVDPQSLFFDVLKNELTYWMAYSQLEPFGSAMVDAAKIQSAIWSTATGKDFPPQDFLPNFNKLDPNSDEQLEKDLATLKVMFGANGI